MIQFAFPHFSVLSAPKCLNLPVRSKIYKLPLQAICFALYLLDMFPPNEEQNRTICPNLKWSQWCVFELQVPGHRYTYGTLCPIVCFLFFHFGHFLIFAFILLAKVQSHSHKAFCPSRPAVLWLNMWNQTVVSSGKLIGHPCSCFVVHPGTLRETYLREICRQLCAKVEAAVQAPELKELHVQLIPASLSPQWGQEGAVLAKAVPAKISLAFSSVATFQQCKWTRTLTNVSQ